MISIPKFWRGWKRRWEKKGKIPSLKFGDLGPCVITWGESLVYGERAPIWATGDVMVNWTFVSVFEEYGKIQLNFSEPKYCFIPWPLTDIAKRFNEAHELRVVSLYGHCKGEDLLFYKTSLMLVDLANKIVKFKILVGVNRQVWRIG